MQPINPADVLLTFAQVSVAFGGFSSLIAVIGMRSSAVAGFDLLRYWMMLEFSLAALALSLLPFVLLLLGVSETWVWRGLSGVAAVFAIGHNAVLARLYLKGEPSVRRAAGPLNMIAANVVYAALGLSQTGNAVGLLGGTVGWYLCGLLLILLVATAHFILFIVNALRSLRQVDSRRIRPAGAALSSASSCRSTARSAGRASVRSSRAAANRAGSRHLPAW
jgi:hypothetical protein